MNKKTFDGPEKDLKPKFTLFYIQIGVGDEEFNKGKKTLFI